MPRLAYASAFVLAIVLLVPGRAAAHPVCTNLDDCKKLCQDGGGVAAACTGLADALAAGRGVAPDHARAAELYGKACRRDDGDAEACLDLGALERTGWMFEVPRDPAAEAPLIERAYKLAVTRCAKDQTDGCYAAARAALARSGDAADAKPAAIEVARLAEAGCTKGKDARACRILEDNVHGWAEEQQVIDPAERDRLLAVARAGKVEACIDGDGRACGWAVWNDRNKAAIPRMRPTIDKLCDGGDRQACMALTVILVDEVEAAKDKAKFKAAVKAAVASCDGEGHDQCGEIINVLLTGYPDGDLAADPRAALAMAERRCQLAGDPAACEQAATLDTDKKFGLPADADHALALRERACQLRGPAHACEVCKTSPDVPTCQLRDAFDEHTRCFEGHPDECEVIGTRFRDGHGVTRDGLAAARHFRRGCDGAQKGACAALDELCLADASFERSLCHQALIHTDLFYEAEWQFRTTGSAQLVDTGDAPAATTATVTVSAGAGGAGSPTGAVLARGHLDADLVVNVVLDRARQAALRLVVDELTSAGRRARARYLRDLLIQGSRLLADPSTLRREKFADLAMTVVRGFVAANLIDTLYPDADALLGAPVIGAVVSADPRSYGLRAGAKVDPQLHAYLVDLAYGLLGDTHLFARVTGDDEAPPPCPSPGWAALCKALGDTDSLEKALKVDRVLDGLRLAKALREAGTLDLRRFIEAATRSRELADLGNTPGLVLAVWQTELVAGTRERVNRVRDQLRDLKGLMRASAYADGGPEIAVLAARAADARTLLDTSTAHVLLTDDDRGHIERILAAVELAAKPALGTDDPRLALRAAAIAEIQAWGARDLVDLFDRITQLEKAAADVRPALDQLERSIYAIQAVMSRFHHAGDGQATLDIGDVPLHAIGELRGTYKDAVNAMGTAERGLRRLYPGEDLPQLEFARSAAVRLLGLFDLMERVARATRLNQTAGDVVAALRLLGVSKGGEFSAPLYDVLDPVLDALKTHEPMSVDLLFGVLARVRLDSLVDSLQGGGNACARDDSVDCWTVKIVHALQESVERDGDLIRVDGGKFAERLAAHGDDFRRKHKWRGYFHLTVGVGSLTSTPPGETASRNVPVIAEQVGFGWASPSLWHDRLTVKVGAAASGVLYRAILDSSESKAIMIHPVFLAVDVYDLVEVYASPLTVLVYPPTDMRGTDVTLGVSAGLSVPLSAYLERL